MLDTEIIFPIVYGKYPERAGKITGMLLELQVSELLLLLDSVLLFDNKIDEALEVLKEHQCQTLCEKIELKSKCEDKPHPESLVPISLSSVEPSQQKQIIGVAIYPIVHAKYPGRAGKVTGMLLELPINELLMLLDGPVQLGAKIEEAYEVLEKYILTNSTSKEKLVCKVEPKIPINESTILPPPLHSPNLDCHPHDLVTKQAKNVKIDKLNDRNPPIGNVQNEIIENSCLSPDSENSSSLGVEEAEICSEVEANEYTNISGGRDELTIGPRRDRLGDDIAISPSLSTNRDGTRISETQQQFCQMENAVIAVRDQLDGLHVNTCDITDLMYETARGLYADEATLIVKLITEKCNGEQLQLLAASGALMEHEVEKAHIKIQMLHSPPLARKSNA